TFNGTLPYHPGGLDFSYKTEAVRFERDLKHGTVYNEDGEIDTSIRADGGRIDQNVFGLARANGTRLNAAPAISLPLEASYGFFKPTMKYDYSHYDRDLNSQAKTQAATANPVFGQYNSSQNRD